MPAAESSRERLLKAGKHLFATRGYENTSTMMIARHAGTSESQLMKHYGSKDGLLAAIFEDGWSQVGAALQTVQRIATPLDKLRALLSETIDALDRDPELKELLLLESRRVRKDGREVLMTRGFLDFTKLVDGVLKEMRDRGELRGDMRPQVLRSALIGMAEGLLRDDLIARRMGFDPLYSREELDHLLDVMLPALVSAPTGRHDINVAQDTTKGRAKR